MQLIHLVYIGQFIRPTFWKVTLGGEHSGIAAGGSGVDMTGAREGEADPAVVGDNDLPFPPPAALKILGAVTRRAWLPKPAREATLTDAAAYS